VGTVIDEDASGDYQAGLWLLFAMTVSLCALLYWMCRQFRGDRLLVPSSAASLPGRS
jgi:hypothetical protein